MILPPSNNSVLCSLHFGGSDFITSQQTGTLDENGREVRIQLRDIWREMPYRSSFPISASSCFLICITVSRLLHIIVYLEIQKVSPSSCDHIVLLHSSLTKMSQLHNNLMVYTTSVYDYYDLYFCKVVLSSFISSIVVYTLYIAHRKEYN